MKLQRTIIPGCFEVEYSTHLDSRGSFVKTFQSSAFVQLGLEPVYRESFYSASAEGVLRGMHFQLPPSDGAKLVYCLDGEVLDLALDLRKGSPSFGQAVSFSLSAARPTAVYIPQGVAHGFVVMRGPSILVYNVSSEYDSKADTGILWNSFGFDWPINSPILSFRDQKLLPLSDFDSPFLFDTRGYGF